MTSFFPDLNVWLALSVEGHRHNADAWNWLNFAPAGVTLVFSRYTHIGLLRLLTNESAMGDRTLTLRKAWGVYDRWLRDPRVEFHPEPRGVDACFRETTAPFAGKAASKWVGDCYLLSCAVQSHATLATFDKALRDFAGREGHPAIIPG